MEGETLRKGIHTDRLLAQSDGETKVPPLPVGLALRTGDGRLLDTSVRKALSSLVLPLGLYILRRCLSLPSVCPSLPGKLHPGRGRQPGGHGGAGQGAAHAVLRLPDVLHRKTAQAADDRAGLGPAGRPRAILSRSRACAAAAS